MLRLALSASFSRRRYGDDPYRLAVAGTATGMRAKTNYRRRYGDG